MSALQVVGRQPDIDASLSEANSIAARKAATSVSATDVDNAANARIADLATKAYVDQQDAASVLQSYVDTQDSKYVGKFQLDATGSGGNNDGVPSLNSQARMPLGTASTSRVKNTNRGPKIITKTSWNGDVITSSSSQFVLGTLVIPDPGYKYVPIVQAMFEQGPIDNGARPDVVCRWGTSTSSPIVSHGSGHIKNSYSRLPLTVLPQDPGAFTGGVTCTFYGFRGFDTGTIYIYISNAWANVILLPVP